MLQKIAAAVLALASLVGAVKFAVDLRNDVDRLDQMHGPDGHSSPLGGDILPSGTVVAYLGTDGAPPSGWVICGTGATPNLNGRFLLGTNDSELVGSVEGSALSNGNSEFRSGYEVDGDIFSPPPPGMEGADNHSDGGQNWNHKHDIQLPTVRVRFFCKD